MNETAFEKWWRDVGSAFTPAPGDDMESHARRVAHHSWIAALDYVSLEILRAPSREKAA